MARINADKNVALWEELGVMSKREADARAEVMFEHYAGVVEIEAKCMIDMITMNVVPDCKKACQVGGASLSSGVISNLEAAVPKLSAALKQMEGQGSPMEKAKLARVLRLETMEEVRVLCDEAEGLVPEGSWSLGTYKELLFLDSQQSSYIAGGGGK
jgi:glutamine synthetase